MNNWNLSVTDQIEIAQHFNNTKKINYIFCNFNA